MQNADAQHYINALQLMPHPEGGYYKEVYKSDEEYPAAELPSRYGANRSFCTSIYFLLKEGDFSAFHRIASDETWHHYDGGTLLLHEIDLKGDHTITRIGKNLRAGDMLQYTVKRGHWFGGEIEGNTGFVLLGCTVAPGFDFEDFELASQPKLLHEYPQHREIIQKLTIQGR